MKKEQTVSEIGRLGGTATFKKYGVKGMSERGKKGGYPKGRKRGKRVDKGHNKGLNPLSTPKLAINKR